MSGLWRGWISLEGGNGLYTGSFSLWNGDSGLIDDNPGETPTYPITAPVLGDAAVPNIAGDWRPVYEIDFVDAYPTGGGIGDTLQCRYGDSQAAAEAVVTPDEATVSESWWIDGEEPFPDLGDYGATLSAGDTLYWQVRVKRGSDYSDWSAFKSLAIADGVMAAPGWTDLTEQSLSTRVWSSGVSVTGLGTGAYARLLGTGPLKVGSTVYEAGDEAQVQNSDTLYAGADLPGTYNATVNNAVTNRGVALETFSATTIVTSLPIPQPSSAAVFYDVSDLSMLWQTNTGTTAVASDGDVVGTWKDWTSNGRDLTSVANDTTRPVYRAGGGYPYLEFDGSNDILRFLGDLGLWNSSGYTAAIAFRSATNAANKMLMGVGGTSSTNQVISLHSVSSQADNATGWIRNNSGVDVLSSSVAITTGFDETDRVLIVVDNGSSVQMYLDGVAGTSRNYTRGSNSLTLNTFSVGGRHGGGSSGLFFATRVHGLAIWPTLNLNSTDRASALTYFASLQGRTL